MSLPPVPPPINAARPPLARRARQAAILAGAVTAGLAGLALALLQWGRNAFRLDLQFQMVGVDFGIALPVALLVLAAGALILAGLWADRRVLASGGVAAPFAVTAAGAGIALLLTLAVTATISAVSARMGFAGGSGGQRYASFVPLSSLLPFEMSFETLVIDGVTNVVTGAVIGAVSWWWAAHHFRPLS